MKPLPRIEETMPYSVPPEASLDHVVFTVADQKFGGAVVVRQNGKAVGIFALIDALRSLGEVFIEHYRKASL